MKWICCLVPMVIVGAVIPAYANLIVNGGFETGDFTGWTINSGGYLGVSSVGLGSPSDTPHSGTYNAYFGAVTGSDIILQSALATVSGQPYTVDFWLAHDETDIENQFTASWDGTTLLNLGNVAAFDWTEYTYTVEGTGSDTLQFSGYEVPAYFGLDDVSVTGQIAPAPEPSTITLLGVWALGLVGWVWRRRMATLALKPS